MNDEHPRARPATLGEQIGTDAARKLRARRRRPAGALAGLRMMGMIGWSISVPTLLGAMLGAWLDHTYPGKHGWTLALLVVGLMLGCFSAWHWVAQEEHALRREAAEDEDA